MAHYGDFAGVCWAGDKTHENIQYSDSGLKRIRHE